MRSSDETGIRLTTWACSAAHVVMEMIAERPLRCHDTGAPTVSGFPSAMDLRIASSIGPQRARQVDEILFALQLDSKAVMIALRLRSFGRLTARRVADRVIPTSNRSHGERICSFSPGSIATVMMTLPVMGKGGQRFLAPLELGPG